MLIGPSAKKVHDILCVCVHMCERDRYINQAQALRHSLGKVPGIKMKLHSLSEVRNPHHSIWIRSDWCEFVCMCVRIFAKGYNRARQAKCCLCERERGGVL